MSDRDFRVDYNGQNEGPFGNTWHDTEEDARKHAAEFVNAGPPDTTRSAYVSRPVATYYMRHSVSSVEYTPIAALSVPEVAESEGLGSRPTRALEIPDAFAEFMKREGAVKWEANADKDRLPDVPKGREVQVMFRDGTKYVRAVHAFDWWGGGENSPMLSEIIAYRVLPIEPAAAKADAGVINEVPDGFTKWNGASGCRFPADTIVHCWMGDDDYMGPLRAGDVDWDHHSDPVLAVKVIRYPNGMTPEYGLEFSEASARPDADGAMDEVSTSPGEVEESRDQFLEAASVLAACVEQCAICGKTINLAEENPVLMDKGWECVACGIQAAMTPDTITIASSSQHAEESARAREVLDAILTATSPLELGPDTVATQTYMDGDQLVVREVTASEFYAQPEVDVTPPAQDLAPLFPPEKPPAATPESLRAGGIVDSEASWWARKLAKEPA